MQVHMGVNEDADTVDVSDDHHNDNDYIQCSGSE